MLAVATVWCMLGCANETPEPLALLNVAVAGQLPPLDGELRGVIVWRDTSEHSTGVATTDDGPVRRTATATG